MTYEAFFNSSKLLLSSRRREKKKNQDESTPLIYYIQCTRAVVERVAQTCRGVFFSAFKN